MTQSEHRLAQSEHRLAQSAVKQRHGHGKTSSLGSDEACQQLDDTKAFKAFKGRGRAGRGEVAELQASLQAIHEEMAALARISKTVRGRSFYLSVHRRAENGQQSLRWRSMVGNRHLPWADMPGLFALQLAPIARWYVDLQARIELLNREECVVRSALRHAMKSA